MVKNEKSTQKKRFLQLLFIVAVACCITLVVLVVKRHHTTPPAIGNAGSKVYTGPTKQEQAESNSHKDDVVQQMQAEEKARTNPDTSPKTVTPIISSASQSGQAVFIGAYMSDVFEDGGSCTLKATLGQKTVTKTGAATKNATTTDCVPFNLNRSDFPAAGDWTVTVSYS